MKAEPTKDEGLIDSKLAEKMHNDELFKGKEPTKDHIPDVRKMVSDTAIAEFFKDLEKDMMTKLFEERAEQAARNLKIRTEQQTASAILEDMNKLENVAKLNPNQIITYEVIWKTLKKHLSETK